MLHAADASADAPVTLFEFNDYQCPFCKRHATTTISATSAYWFKLTLLLLR